MPTSCAAEQAVLEWLTSSDGCKLTEKAAERLVAHLPHWCTTHVGMYINRRALLKHFQLTSRQVRCPALVGAALEHVIAAELRDAIDRNAAIFVTAQQSVLHRLLPAYESNVRLRSSSR